MQQIQLYIGNQRIDMFKDESVSITDTIKDVKDISKIFTEYSQTFEIPASKINNKVFTHYYDNDIVGGFDARVRASAFIELNSAPFKKGFIKLEGVDLKNNIAHTYRITFFGNTVSLKRLLGDDKLTDLRWLDNFNTRNSGADIRYVSSDIEDYLTAKHNKTFGGVTYDNPVQVPLVTHTERLYYNSAQNDANTGNLHYSTADTSIKKGVKWTELKYALKLTAIIDAIQAPIEEGGYGITFSDDFFNNSTNTAFNDLSMWLHRIRGQATSGGQEVSTTTQPTGWADAGGSFGTPSMSNNIFAIGFGSYSYSLHITPSNNDTYSYQVFRETSSFVNGQPVNTPFTLIHSSGNVNGQSSLGLTVTTITARFYIEITSTTQINFTSINWRASATGGNIFPDSNFTLTNYLKTVVFNLVMTQQLPKMKVLDFLTSIFNMFSLVAYFEDEILVVKSLDDFYNTGRGGSLSSEQPFDITQYVDVTKKTVDVALPFREVKYSYSGLKTFLAAQHEQLFNEEWGTEEYKGEDTTILSEEIFKVTIPFEHMKFEKLIDVTTSAIQNILWGYFVDDNQRPYIGQPAIFNTKLITGSISFVSEVDFEGVPLQYKQLTSYQVPSNTNMNAFPVSSQPTINFAAEIDEFTFAENSNTLFKDFHKNYISSVFSESNRLTMVKAFLPLRILLKYNLNDRFVIAGKQYKINSIETNLYTGQSDIELLKDI